MGHLNLGQDVSSLRFFAICGLQEGFEPFAINMQRPVTTWFSKSLPQFEPVPLEHPHYEVGLIPVHMIIISILCCRGPNTAWRT